MNTQTEQHIPYPDKSRREVARDMLVFQVKLFVDGFKDIVLSPISLIAGLTGILIGRQPGLPLYSVMRLGKRMERWVDLFGASYPDEIVRHSEDETAVGATSGSPESSTSKTNQPGSSQQESTKQPLTHARAEANDFDSLITTLEQSFFDKEARSRLSERSKRQLDSLANRLRRSDKNTDDA